jgi:hypothetical protein
MPRILDPKRCTCKKPAILRVTVSTSDGEVLDSVLLCRDCARLAQKPLEDLGLAAGDLGRIQ